MISTRYESDPTIVIHHRYIFIYHASSSSPHSSRFFHLLLTLFPPTNTSQLHIRQILSSPCYSHLAKLIHALLAHRIIQRTHQIIRILHQLHLHNRVLILAHRLNILPKRLLVDQTHCIDGFGELPQGGRGSKNERIQHGRQNDAPKIGLRDDDPLNIRDGGRVFVLVQIQIARHAREDPRARDDHLGTEAGHAVAHAVHDRNERLRVDRTHRIDVFREQNLQEHKHRSLVFRPFLSVRKGKRGNREGLEGRADHDFEVHLQNVFKTGIVVKWKHAERNVLPL